MRYHYLIILLIQQVQHPMLYMDQSSIDYEQKNMFMRRIIGLTSYFRSAQESLLPRYEETPKYYRRTI